MKDLIRTNDHNAPRTPGLTEQTSSRSGEESCVFWGRCAGLCGLSWTKPKQTDLEPSDDEETVEAYDEEISTEGQPLDFLFERFFHSFYVERALLLGLQL